MLIVPAAHRFDAAHLPLATIFLIAACLLVFLAYQSDDDRRVSAALDSYAQENLLAYEAPLLESYAGADAAAGMDAALDPAFDAYVHAYWTTAEPDAAWRDARARFEAVRNRISALRFGLAPAEMKPASLLAHMFLHADLWHLLGNMIFLLLFGMLLERLLGSALFFLAYVLTGLAAAGVFALAHAGSHVPMIGASGAISGLMGAYLGVYGLRKVRFFYTLGFWFGEFTAQALLVFPLWLGKELYGWFEGTGPVAYAAHAGGLLAGLAIALLLKRRAATTLDADTNTQRADTTRRETLTRIRQLLTDLRIDDALKLAAQAVRQSPGELSYWQVYAEAANRVVANAEHDRAMAILFENADKPAMSLAFLREVLARYRQRGGDGIALHGRAGAVLARRFMREGSVHDADQLLDALFRANALSPAFNEVLAALLQFAEKNSDRRRAQRYRQYLAAMTGDGQAVADPS